MNIEFDAYKVKLNDVKPALDGLSESLNVEGLRNELERLNFMQEAPGFWDDPDKSQKIVVKTKQTQAKIERYEKMVASWEDLMTICEMAAEEDDDSMLDELKEGFAALESGMEACRLETLLNVSVVLLIRKNFFDRVFKYLFYLFIVFPVVNSAHTDDQLTPKLTAPHTNGHILIVELFLEHCFGLMQDLVYGNIACYSVIYESVEKLANLTVEVDAADPGIHLIFDRVCNHLKFLILP